MELVQLRVLKREAVRAKNADSKSLSARDRIILAATIFLKDHNFQELSIESIAKSAHVTRRTLYNHFESKQELYQYIRMDALRRLMIKRAIDIPERMDICDGVRFFVEHVHEVVGDRDNIETLQAIVRDGASQPWLRSDYLKLVRDPMTLSLENFILRHVRRSGTASRISRDICEQLILTIESMFVHPLITSDENSDPSRSRDISLGIIGDAFSSLFSPDMGRARPVGGLSQALS